MKIQTKGIEIEVEDSATQDAGHRTRPVVLLIMGLGMQLVAWPPQMVEAFEDSGYRVVRFDNRDIGLSSHMAEAGRPNMPWNMLKYQLGFVPKPPYSLTDMASDALGVLDALGIAQAHVVGVSMGGMIAQRLAIAASQRVLSLTSIMSSSGAKGLPGPQAQVLKVMMAHPRSADEALVLAHYVRLFRTIGSPAYPLSEADLRENILRGIRRSYYPEGTTRQMLAVASDVTRAQQLQRIVAPTLVLHGKADPLLPYACGEDTARRIPGARLVGIEGMGHDLPPVPVNLMLQSILPHMANAQAKAGSSPAPV